MIQKIVLATDLGPFAGHAMEHALDMAVNHQAKVTAVHAVEPLSSFAHAMVSTYLESDDPSNDLSGPAGLLASIRDQMERSLGTERSDIDPDYNCFVDFVVEQGRPAEVILAQTQKLGADLIIMGSHGPEAMGNNVLGSVTTRVLQLSKVPVYMVPMISPRNWFQLGADERVGRSG